MLNEMDGFDTDHRIIVLAATNRADVLDPALTRPGRLDRQIQVPAPDRRGRTRILEVHARNRPMADDVDLVGIARRTPGMSGADLAQVVNEACMEAARRDLVVVDAAAWTPPSPPSRSAGPAPRPWSPSIDRRITAWHEAGHAIAALLLEDADDPVQVSIVPRGPAGGVTWMSGNDDMFLTRARALADLRVAMGGRAAEELLLDGEYTQGAHGDLATGQPPCAGHGHQVRHDPSRLPARRRRHHPDGWRCRRGGPHGRRGAARRGARRRVHAAQHAPGAARRRSRRRCWTRRTSRWPSCRRSAGRCARPPRRVPRPGCRSRCGPSRPDARTVRSDGQADGPPEQE